MRPINIKIPGLASKTGISGASKGVLLGRVGGRGPVQVLRDIHFQQMGLVTKGQIPPPTTGFNFYAGGLMLSNEDIGQGVWSHDETFENGIAGSIITSLFPAAATAVFDIYQIVGGVPSVIGTITFAATSTAGVLNVPAPVTVSAGNPVRLNAPNPADATLASVSGTVIGIAA